MAKKGRSKKNSHEHKSNARRKVVFFFSMLLIGFMLWTVLQSVTQSSAQSKKGKSQSNNAQNRDTGRFCRRNGRESWFSFCQTGSSTNSCGDGCSCTPFIRSGKWGVCKKGAGVPQTATTPPGAACGATCTADADCQTGYCHPGGFEICPTAAPGQPLEPCILIPPDPTAPNVCMPVTCKTGTNCSCPVVTNPPGGGGGGTNPGNNHKDDDKDGETDEQDEKPGSNDKDDDRDGETDEQDEKIGNNHKDDDGDGKVDEQDEKDDDAVKTPTGAATNGQNNLRFILK